VRAITSEHRSVSIISFTPGNGNPFELEHAFNDTIIASNLRCMLLMRRIFFVAALILIVTATVHATEALLFNGGGYTIEVLIGYVDAPVVAQVRVTPPEAKDSIIIPRKLIRVENFNMKKRILTMHFSNKNDPGLPASFSLSASKTKAVLSISGKEIKSDFNWTFEVAAKFIGFPRGKPRLTPSEAFHRGEQLFLALRDHRSANVGNMIEAPLHAGDFKEQ
jgi:hypothetical protein